jgi:Tol biopolymer transport system component
MADGNSLLVAANYQPPNESGFFSYDAAIVNVVDGALTPLPELMAEPDGPIRANLQIWLSPDTSKAVVLTTREDGLPGLGVFDIASRTLVPILDSVITFGSDHIPMANVQWSPDGSEIYWIDMEVGMTVYTAHADGTDLTRIGDLQTGGLAFSPDLRSMAYSVYDDAGNSTLYVSDIDGGGVIEIDRKSAVGGVGTGFAFAWRRVP